MHILITGSSGTIGTRLFEALLQKGYEVTGIDRRPNKWNPSLNARTRLVDMLDKGALSRVAGDFDMLIHLAANARVYDLVKMPELALENTVTAFNALEFARARGIKKLMFSSSRETYGNIKDGGAIAEDAVRIERCESAYAASKLSGEAYFHSYAVCYGMQNLILRFSNVYGMYDDSDRVIPLWIRQLKRNEDITVFGKEKTLDFTHIDDCVGGVVQAVEKFGAVAGNTLNMAYGEDVTLLHVAERLQKLLGAKSKLIVKGNRTGEVWKFRADISRAKKLLGYSPKVSIDEGLARAVAWYGEHLRE
jgi:UDP-glucose 4-epimerase